MSLPLRSILPRCHPRWNGWDVCSFAFLSSSCLARAGRQDPSLLPRPSPSSNYAPPRPSPREQCFLYTELVHGLTQQAAAQIAADDTEQPPRPSARSTSTLTSSTQPRPRQPSASRTPRCCCTTPPSASASSSTWSAATTAPPCRNTLKQLNQLNDDPHPGLHPLSARRRKGTQKGASHRQLESETKR